jgi:hypothetical protein
LSCFLHANRPSTSRENTLSEENTIHQKLQAPVLIPSEPDRLSAWMPESVTGPESMRAQNACKKCRGRHLPMLAANTIDPIEQGLWARAGCLMPRARTHH